MKMTASPQSTEARLAGLRLKHRSLDRDVRAEQMRPVPDLGTIKSLKRDKLRAKDEIARLEGVMRTLDRRSAKAVAKSGPKPERTA